MKKNDFFQYDSILFSDYFQKFCIQKIFYVNMLDMIKWSCFFFQKNLYFFCEAIKRKFFKQRWFYYSVTINNIYAYYLSNKKNSDH